MNSKKKYVVTLRDGDTKTVYILDHPVFSCMVSYEGGRVFLTAKQINEKGADVLQRGTEPYLLWQPYIGPILNEQAIFDAYKGLRNPVVKIELMDNGDY